jgi:hypothetical protein
VPRLKRIKREAEEVWDYVKNYAQALKIHLLPLTKNLLVQSQIEIRPFIKLLNDYLQESPEWLGCNDNVSYSYREEILLDILLGKEDDLQFFVALYQNELGNFVCVGLSAFENAKLRNIKSKFHCVAGYTKGVGRLLFANTLANINFNKEARTIVFQASSDMQNMSKLFGFSIRPVTRSEVNVVYEIKPGQLALSLEKAKVILDTNFLPVVKKSLEIN